MKEDVVVILRDVLNYSESDAKELVRQMLSKKHIALVAISQPSQDEPLKVVGIIGAIPQYGVTGWELHPLAVLPQYQRKGIGTLLIETLEDEVASQGGVMMKRVQLRFLVRICILILSTSSQIPKTLTVIHFRFMKNMGTRLLEYCQMQMELVNLIF